MAPEQVARSLIPRLNETLFEVLSEGSFRGNSVIIADGAAGFQYSCEKLIMSLIAFSLRVLGGRIAPMFKVTLTSKVEGIPVNDPIRVRDLLTVDVKCEKLPDVVHYQSLAEKKDRRFFMALVNYATE